MLVASVTRIACEIAALVVALTVVRRHRPDAYRKLAAWAAAVLVVTVITWVLMADGLSTVFGLDGATARVLAMCAVVHGTGATEAAQTIVRALADVALLILFVRAMVALAQPPKPVVATSDAPYR